jgi:hypothetical protein
MITTRLVILIILSHMVVTGKGFDDTTAVIKETLNRYFCNQIYWHIEKLPSQITQAYKVKIIGNRFTIFFESVKPKSNLHMLHFLYGRIKNGTGAIITGYGRNAKYIDKRTQTALNQFEDGGIVNDSITIPIDCIPKYDSSAQKEKMVETVVSTMQKELGDTRRRGLARYPNEVNLFIANFTVDQGGTLVIVEPSDGLVYDITFHDPHNYDSDKYEQEGEYPHGEKDINSYNKMILEKIKRYAIKRRIALIP